MSALVLYHQTRPLNERVQSTILARTSALWDGEKWIADYRRFPPVFPLPKLS